MEITTTYLANGPTLKKLFGSTCLVGNGSLHFYFTVYWLSKLWDPKSHPIEKENGLFRVYYEWDDILPSCVGILT